VGLLGGKKRGTAPQAGAQTGQFEVWVPRSARGVEAVGEFYHQREFRALFPKGHNDRSVELKLPVRIVHSLRNGHDSNTVEILGFVSQSRARLQHEHPTSLRSSQCFVQCDHPHHARIQVAGPLGHGPAGVLDG